MLSRVAESIFWMGRYLERAENVARLVSVSLHLEMDLSEEDADPWGPLVLATGDSDLFHATYDAVSRDKVLEFYTAAASYPSSIFSCLAAARENARSIRETISREVWEEINTLYLSVRQLVSDHSQLSDTHGFCQQFQRSTQLLRGVIDGTLTHSEAWNFQRLGRQLERADKTSRILDVKYFVLLPEVTSVGTAIDVNQWAALLKSISALDMYRQRFHRISPERVVEFLVLDSRFPRAIHYCVREAEQSLYQITGSTIGTYCNRAEQLLGKLRAELGYMSVAELFQRGLHEALDSIQAEVNRVSDAVSETFFGYGAEPSSRQTQEQS